MICFAYILPSFLVFSSSVTSLFVILIYCSHFLLFIYFCPFLYSLYFALFIFLHFVFNSHGAISPRIIFMYFFLSFSSPNSFSSTLLQFCLTIVYLFIVFLSHRDGDVKQWFDLLCFFILWTSVSFSSSRSIHEGKYCGLCQSFRENSRN